MKKRTTMIGIIAASALLISVLGYWILSTALSFSYPLKDAQSHYQNAVAKLQDAQNLQLFVTTTTTRQIGDQTYTKNAQQTINFQGLETPNFAASVEETLQVGSHTTNISEQYYNGTVYLTIHESNFSGNRTAAEFLQQYPPAVLLDHKLYKSIRGEVRQRIAVLTFAKATNPEIWALPENCEFVQAEGKAWLTPADDLARSQYKVTYRHAEATVTVQYDVQIESCKQLPVSLPSATDTYTPLTAPYAPKILETSSGYLTQSGSLTAVYNEHLLCQAFGDSRDREVRINMHTGEAWSARLDTAITVTNSSREDAIANFTQSEIFLNGAHTVSTNGAAPESDATISEEHLRNYCHELMLGTVILPKFITDAVCTEQNNILRIKFGTNEDFAKSISYYVCETLYQDASVLDSIADNYATNSVQCYLDISIRTGLPVASGVYFSGSHTIHDLEYQLIYQADQIYTLPSTSAKDTILSPLP